MNAFVLFKKLVYKHKNSKDMKNEQYRICKMQLF